MRFTKQSVGATDKNLVMSVYIGVCTAEALQIEGTAGSTNLIRLSPLLF